MRRDLGHARCGLDLQPHVVGNTTIDLDPHARGIRTEQARESQETKLRWRVSGELGGAARPGGAVEMREAQLSPSDLGRSKDRDHGVGR